MLSLFIGSAHFCQAATVNESSVVLSGKTEYSAYKEDGATEFVAHTELFTLTIGESGRWHMVVDSSFAKDGPFEVAFDGKDVFTVQYSKRIWGRDANGELQVVQEFSDPEKGRYNGSVVPGAFPSDNWPTTKFTWLALASGTYLRSLGDDKTIPAIWWGWTGARRQPMAYGYYLDFEEFSNDALGSPAFAALVAGRLPDIREISSLDAPTTREAFEFQQDQMRQYRLLNPGAVAAEYQVLAST